MWNISQDHFWFLFEFWQTLPYSEKDLDPSNSFCGCRIVNFYFQIIPDNIQLCRSYPFKLSIFWYELSCMKLVFSRLKQVRASNTKSKQTAEMSPIWCVLNDFTHSAKQRFLLDVNIFHLQMSIVRGGGVISFLYTYFFIRLYILLFLNPKFYFG